jgi:hypothetical protein
VDEELDGLILMEMEARDRRLRGKAWEDFVRERFADFLASLKAARDSKAAA